MNNGLTISDISCYFLVMFLSRKHRLFISSVACTQVHSGLFYHGSKEYGPGQAAPKGLVWSGRTLYIGHQNNLSPANKVHCK